MNTPKTRQGFTYLLQPGDEDWKLATLLRREFGFSGHLMYKFKEQDRILLNGNPVPGYTKGQPGDRLEVLLPQESSYFEPEDIPIHPVYEDEDLLILNKQPGVTVHPTNGHKEHTLANGLMQYMADTRQTFKIRFINRLDMDTSGLLMVAKNAHAQNALNQQMRADETEKRYQAVVAGIVEEDAFTINLPIGRPPDSIRRAVLPVTENGYPSITHVKVLERYPSGYTLVELRLETGRTHQIRVHMSHIGHPLLGDWLYDGPMDLFPSRQALHAYYLAFRHPVTGVRTEVRAPLPEDIAQLLETLRNQ